ncbi:MAG: porin [Pikeienuella sp.]
MKKALFATSALVAAGLATSASAAEWSSKVNGYWFVGIAASDDDSGTDGIGILRDGEIHFNASLKADNGLTFKSRVELESFTSGDQIDENWASVGGSFGTIKIGGDDDASYNNNVGIIYAPGARVGYYDAFSINTTGGAFTDGPSVGGDGLGIHYTSPSFNGFSAGFTYMPNSGIDNAADNNNVNFEANNFWAVGANFSTEVDGFGFGMSGGYTDAAGANNDTYTVGANLSAGGFKIAGTFEDDQTDEFAVGMQYSAGPMTIAGGYADDDGGDQTATGWLTYSIAPGVSGTVAVEYVEDAANNEGLGGLAYLSLKF